MEKKESNHKKWAGDKKPSMKRRSEEKDYLDRGIYLITIATACLTEGIPLIVLLLKGFPPYFKPQPRYLQACAEGRLLMLAPYPFQNEKLTDMRARCLTLNNLAARICQDSAKLMY